jgi:hypothetical protein
MDNSLKKMLHDPKFGEIMDQLRQKNASRNVTICHFISET